MSQSALCKGHGKTSRQLNCSPLHVKSGLDAKQLSIIWQSLQIETVTKGAAEFQFVANLGNAIRMGPMVP